MPTPAPPAELMSSLLRRYQAQGCAASFERLVRHYSPLVEKIARQLLHGDAEATREVAQRVFADFARLGREPGRIHAQGPPAG